MDSTKACKILNIEISASAEQIKKAYQKLAREIHPDRPNSSISNGNRNKQFSDLKKAYAFMLNLKSDEKRKPGRSYTF